MKIGKRCSFLLFVVLTLIFITFYAVNLSGISNAKFSPKKIEASAAG